MMWWQMVALKKLSEPNGATPKLHGMAQHLISYGLDEAGVEEGAVTNTRGLGDPGGTGPVNKHSGLAVFIDTLEFYLRLGLADDAKAYYHDKVQEVAPDTDPGQTTIYAWLREVKGLLVGGSGV